MPKHKNTKGFIILNRDHDLSIHKFPNDFNLLTIIALRAKRTDSYENIDLEIGEALIGDFKNYGLTEQEYRTSKSRLIKAGLITVKSTGKGTIARLVNSAIYDINAEESTDESTQKQQADNEQTTTNNNDNTENNDEQHVGLDYFKSVPSKDLEELSESVGVNVSTVQTISSHLYAQYARSGSHITFPKGLLKSACEKYLQNQPKPQKEPKTLWFENVLDPRYFSVEADLKRQEKFESLMAGKKFDETES